MKSCEHQNLQMISQLEEIKDNWVIWGKPQKDKGANVAKHKITQTVPIQVTHMPSCSRGRWQKHSYKIRQTQVKVSG